MARASKAMKNFEELKKSKTSREMVGGNRRAYGGTRMTSRIKFWRQDMTLLLSRSKPIEGASGLSR